MRNIALFLTYEGTAYHGWQSQKNLATVQQTLEKAISMVVSHDVHVTVRGTVAGNASRK
jgi:tRNA pseudouridine38-40 synthase